MNIYKYAHIIKIAKDLKDLDIKELEDLKKNLFIKSRFTACL